MLRRIVPVAALAALVLPFVSVVPAGAAPASRLVPCSRAAERIEVTVSSHLDPSCTYTGGLDVTRSGVVLDCRDAIVRGPITSPLRGIEVVTPAEVPMSDVTVRRCHTEGFINGIRVTRTGFRALARGHEYDHPLHHVTIEDSSVTGSRGVGLYVDGYVSDVTVRRSTVTGAGSTGIYLEAGSRDNVVEDNVVQDNGFRENGPEGSLFRMGSTTIRFWGPGREGIAVDGSYRNRISRNVIRGNSNGGIFLYTNCGEYVRSRPERWFERRFGADDNLVSDNSFVGGTTGVWVASRMGENTFPMECSDPAYLSGPVLRVSLDRAAGNTIQRNTFRDVTYGVRVEDDRTTVVANTFEAPDPTHHAVLVGTRLRTSALDHPVRDALIAGNRSSIVGNPNPYRWVHGVEGLVFERNRALRRQVGICEAPALPARQFIFVDALVVEDPNGPPTPRPDYEVPTLGALPACGTAPK